MNKNIDCKTVEGFGDEWSRFDQSALSNDEHGELFDRYFHIFPWQHLSAGAVGFDLGCGSGRWAKLVSPKVDTLHCIDPSSEALVVARRNLADRANCQFHHASVDGMPLEDGSMDFGYSLGVLHHIPDTLSALRSCTKKLKPGAPFLLYLYYAFDNKPFWFRLLWQSSDILRRLISRLPYGLRYMASQIIAGLVYYPLARGALILERAGRNVENLPLAAYRNLSFYSMRTDALDRFGTRLEQRFTADQIKLMMRQAGLERIVFSDKVPFWCALGYKSKN